MLAAGSRVGPYEIVEWLGAGGMGEVYRARDPRLQRDVAIKIIGRALAADEERLRRFELEARAAGQLNHPGILAIYDIGVHHGAPFIVSELLEGEALRSRLGKGALPMRSAIELARQLADALAAAHEKNVVHRDIKPDNLFLTTTGRLKVLDFGIAKLITPSHEVATATSPPPTATGTVIGTPGYMSPEQVRGEPVDHRTDIFGCGIVLHEMLSGRPPFSRATHADTMVAILAEEPPPLPDASPALARIVSRCLEKSRDMRFQSARDLAFGLEVMTDQTRPAPAVTSGGVRRWWVWRAAAALAAAGVLAAVIAYWPRASREQVDENPLARATFTPFTNFEGSELDAAISHDGRFVAFVADRSGQFHVWLKQVGAGPFVDLTPGDRDLRGPGTNRRLGFSGDDSEVWIGEVADGRLGLVPLTGGAPRAFLPPETINAVWSPDGARLLYFTRQDGDPFFVADRTGGNPRRLLVDAPGDHNHFPAWSLDGQWIYYTHAAQGITLFDIWRIPSSGGSPERLTNLNRNLRYLTPIDANTVLFVAPDEDRSGPWLWALDVERRAVRRVSVGLERYLSVAASADGRRLVATVANPTASLWRAPIRASLVGERDLKPYATPTRRALAPRFSGSALFFLSSTGPGDGLWRLREGKAEEIWKGSDGPLLESPGISPLGDRVALVLQRQGKLRLAVLAADGAGYQSIAEALDIRGAPSWSPDGQWIVTGASDAQGAGLFKAALNGGAVVRLASGNAIDPVWSPDATLIVYTGHQGANAPLLAVRPDGTPVALPKITVPAGGGGRSRFLPDGSGLVYVQGAESIRDFWLLDLRTGRTRRLTTLASPATIESFDISPDGKEIVFDRLRENSDIRLIDLQR
jgi:Tol biopolymer transport system component